MQKKLRKTNLKSERHLQIWKCHSIFLKCHLIFTTFVLNFYSNNMKNHRIVIPIELFSFYGNLKDQLCSGGG